MRCIHENCCAKEFLEKFFYFRKSQSFENQTFFACRFTVFYDGSSWFEDHTIKVQSDSYYVLLSSQKLGHSGLWLAFNDRSITFVISLRFALLLLPLTSVVNDFDHCFFRNSISKTLFQSCRETLEKLLKYQNKAFSYQLKC